MDRYSEITNKNQREIVLLKGFPCIWGKCSFCDYIDDNSNLEEEMNKLNLKVLKNVTGKYGVLGIKKASTSEKQANSDGSKTL